MSKYDRHLVPPDCPVLKQVCDRVPLRMPIEQSDRYMVAGLELARFFCNGMRQLIDGFNRWEE